MLITYDNRALEIEEVHFDEYYIDGVINSEGHWLATEGQFFAVGEQLGQIPAYIIAELEDGEIHLFEPEEHLH